MSSAVSSRAGAWRRFEEFLPSAGRSYAENRNFDHGPGGPVTTSRLSAALQRRLVAEEEILRRTLAVHSFEAAEKFLQEVVWRTYWKGWLEWHPSVWDDYRRSLLERPAGETYARALAAATGIAPFDAWRRELAETGFLHNHARMWFASIWIFTLGLPWSWGAELFLRELVDGDAASNTLSWRWVAGLQTRGKHYVARAENIERYTGGRFRPTGQLNEEAVPLFEAVPPRREASLPEFPETALPDGRLGLLVHSEDYGVETTSLGATTFAAIGLVAPPTEGKAAVAAELERSAAEDARERLRARYGVRPVLLENEESYRAWCRDRDAVVTVAPWVGPVRDRVAPWLAASPRPVWLARRVYDLELLPLATRGFFSFRKALPPWAQTVAERGGPSPVRFRKAGAR